MIQNFIKTHFGYNFLIALEAIFQNKLRAVLTSLGIIFGVASVIAMLAIGKGAEQEILEKIKLLGTNNIIIKPIEKKAKEKADAEDQKDTDTKKEEKDKKKYTPGLTLRDVEAIKESVPNVKTASSEVVFETLALREGLKRDVKVVGVDPSYFSINQFNIYSGSNFVDKQVQGSESVCIIGYGIKSRLFPAEDPIGKQLKCGNEWLKVIGIVEEKNVSKENIKSFGLRNFNYDVYVPVSTMLLRFLNRSLITKSDLQVNVWYSSQTKAPEENPNQVDRVIVEVSSSEYIASTAEILKRMMLRRHNNVEDFEIVVPESLLEQEQSTKRIFNIVLGAIASISLIVGGIGIMNIMLASVLERTKEIGIRQAIGATKNDVLMQFLGEAISISLTGGFIGIILGIGLSYFIEKATDIVTIVTPFSVFISFIVSISVGLIFGIAPAKKASQQNPIDLLRYE
jgi:putative ABC transport system permease protein